MATFSNESVWGFLMSQHTIHIIGDSFVAPLAAMTLGRKIPTTAKQIRVTLTNLRHYGTLCAFSDIKMFHDALGLSEPVFMRGTNACYNLCAHVIGPASDGIFSDSDYGFMVAGAQFHQLFAKLKRKHRHLLIEDFCLPAVLAKNNKFAPPNNTKKSIFNNINYGYNFSEAQYFSVIKTLAESLNISFENKTIASINCNQDGISQVIFTDGESANADLFIDCTEAGTLISELTGHSNLQNLIPNWHLELQNNEVFSENPPPMFSINLSTLSKKVQKDSVMRNQQHRKSFAFTGEPHHSARIHNRAWTQNCIALGEAYAKLPNILLDRHHLPQSQLLQLIDISSTTPPSDAVKDVFNRASERAVTQLIDIDNLLIHELMPDKVELSKANSERLKLYQLNGSTRATENSIIPDSHWPILFSILGYNQSGNDAFSNLITNDFCEKQLSSMFKLTKEAADAAPTHNFWLKKIGV